jgi:transcriptional antiterminator NusG
MATSMSERPEDEARQSVDSDVVDASEAGAAERAVEGASVTESAPSAAEGVEAADPRGSSSLAASDAGTAASIDASATAEGVGVGDEDDDEDDGTPAVPEDPFAGDEDARPVEELVEAAGEAPPGEMQWYILKVQSNREDSIREALLRRVSMQGMERFFGEVIVPKEQVTEFKSGKKRVVSRKLYPGYILVNMILNDETWFLVRETGGIGDFTGSGGRPSPMLPGDVAKLLHKDEETATEAPRLKINFRKGDRVKINEGTFENFEGEVEQIDEANGRVTVMLSIFGRSTPVDIEYWQIESV